MSSLHEKLSPRLTAALPSILGEVANLPYLTGGHSCGRGGCSILINLDGRGSPEAAATILNPRLQAAVQKGGYTLLPGGSMWLKPTVGNAISHDASTGVVALKLLDGVTEELQILQRLLAFQSEANHTIKLDVIKLDTELSNRCHVIVMPWQMTLTQCLEEKTRFPQEGVASHSVPRRRCVSTRAWNCSPRPEARECPRPWQVRLAVPTPVDHRLRTFGLCGERRNPG